MPEPQTARHPAAYDVHAYTAEKREALTKWAKHLAALPKVQP